MTLTKYEMWDVARDLKPGITWREFEGMWQRFLEHRRKRDQQ